GITRDTADSREMVQREIVPNSPSDVMVGARSVPTHPDSTDDFLAGTIQCESSAEHVHPTNLLSYHGIMGCTVIRRRSFVCNACVNRVALLQSEKTAARLHRRVQVRGRER